MKKRIVALLIAIAVLFTFAACGKPKRPSAESVVVNTFEALKALDKEKIKEALGTEGPAEDFEELDETTQTMLKLSMKNFTYKIISSEEQEETATVKAEITNTDMVKLLTDATSQLVVKILNYMGEHDNQQPSDEETYVMLQEIFDDYMTRDDLETVTKTEDIALSLTDGKWKPQITADQLDTILGGLYTFQKNQSQQ